VIERERIRGDGDLLGFIAVRPRLV
jgi:hypothetical protein